MKNWLITGVSRGLGKALAEAALARGDTVIGTVRDGDPLIAKGKGVFHRLSLDMRDPKAIEAAASRTFELVERLDVLVNNAGHGLLGPIESVSDRDMISLFETNVFGPVRLIRAVLPRLRAQRAGHIVNVTSIAGRAPNAGSGVYAATKSALEGLSKALSQELAPLGIKVTAIAPGAFRTDFLSDHSIRRTDAGSEDYAASAGKVLVALDNMAGKQIGDPVRAAHSILKVVDSDTPPLHLLLGSDALRREREKLDNLIDEMDRWEAETRSTDYPA